MQRDFSCFDDITLVTGLKTTDDVLFVGANMRIPHVKDHCRSVNFVKRSSDLNRLVFGDRRFDKIFIGRENVLAEELVTRAAQIVATGGLVCFFSDDEVLRGGFVEVVEARYPTADVWALNSNIGPLVVTNACGNPGGME